MNNFIISFKPQPSSFLLAVIIIIIMDCEGLIMKKQHLLSTKFNHSFHQQKIFMLVVTNEQILEYLVSYLCIADVIRLKMLSKEIKKQFERNAKIEVRILRQHVRFLTGQDEKNVAIIKSYQNSAINPNDLVSQYWGNKNFGFNNTLLDVSEKYLKNRRQYINKSLKIWRMLNKTPTDISELKNKKYIENMEKSKSAEGNKKASTINQLQVPNAPKIKAHQQLLEKTKDIEGGSNFYQSYRQLIQNDRQLQQLLIWQKMAKQRECRQREDQEFRRLQDQKRKQIIQKYTHEKGNTKYINFISQPKNDLILAEVTFFDKIFSSFVNFVTKKE